MVTIWNTTVWAYLEGCPIHPTRVDSSLVFAIRQTGNRFVNPILSNRQESFFGSRFARDLENIVDLDFEDGLKMSIRVDSIEWTQIVRIDWSLWPRFKNEEGSCIVYFTDLDFRWAMQGGLKMLSIRLDSMESTRIVSPVVDSSYRKSICETRLRANRVES